MLGSANGLDCVEVVGAWALGRSCLLAVNADFNANEGVTLVGSARYSAEGARQAVGMWQRAQSTLEINWAGKLYCI